MTGTRRLTKTHRISTKAIAITAGLLFLLMAIAAVAVAATGDSGGTDDSDSIYDSGYVSGHAFAVAKGLHVDEDEAWHLCWEAAQNNQTIAEFQWQAMASGCTAGMVDAS